MRRTRLACAAAFALAAAAARACFPGATWQLLQHRHDTLTQAPSNSFAWEAARLVPPSPWYHPPPNPPPGTPPDADPRGTAERLGLSVAQIAALAAMRAAPDSRWALQAAGGLPPAIRLYTGGAVAFAHGNFADAREYFGFVLALPPPQAAPRMVWAQYMLGRVAAHDAAFTEAEHAFAAVRDRVAHGAPDPLGLAVASLGEQARLRLGQADIIGATSLYAEQAADGSDEAVQSLRLVAERAMAHPDGLPALAADPLTQKLLVVHALGLTGDALHHLWIGNADDGPALDGFWSPENLETAPLKALLAAVRAQPRVALPDRLAALAYRLGDMEAARDLAGRAPTALSLWVKAKLALETGDDARPLFAAALHAALAEAPQTTAVEPSSIGLLRGETSVAILNAGDVWQAAEVLWPAASAYWGDFAYLAERVLTTDELRRFVDQHAPEGAAPGPAVPGWAGENFTPARGLRDLLARRLVRDGRIPDALPYFATKADVGTDRYDPRPDAEALDAAQRRARDAFWAIDRARAAWTAASLLRAHGMELMGTEEEPDQAFVGGEFEYWIGPEAAGSASSPNTDVSHAEMARVDASRAKPDVRFHYRYLAIDQALAAARDLPPHSQAYAAVLCQAAGWSLGVNDAVRAVSIYRQYIAHGARVGFATRFGHACPAPDFAAARMVPARVAWLDARSAIHRHKPAAFGAMAGILALAVLPILVRRRSSSKTAAGESPSP